MVPLKSCRVVLLAAMTSLVTAQDTGKNHDKVPAAPERSGSVITIHVHKAGLFSGFGHNHTVTAPVTRGRIDNQGMAADIVVVTQDMKVIDADVSDKDRAQIQTDMLGPKVLDAARFPEIRFASSRIESTGPGHYRVTGKLELHGVGRELTFEVTGGPERYHGQTRLKQTDFAIRPISVAGGTVKVKDEIELEFDVRAADLPGGTK